MRKLSTFEIVSDIIGIENTLNLMRECGGMVFYIPKLPIRDIDIYEVITKLHKIGYNKTQISNALQSSYGISKFISDSKINEYLKGQQ